MRILGEINDLPYKVTALEMNNRIAIKIEDGQHELTFKFRDGSAVQTMADVQAFVQQEGQMEHFQQLFASMHQARRSALRAMLAARDIEFPEII